MFTHSPSGVKKLCCKCGKDVTHSQRFKDQHGYWCAACNQADHVHQIHAGGGICEGCGDLFSPSQLMEISGQTLCASCRRHRFAHGHNQAHAGFFDSIKSMFGR